MMNRREFLKQSAVVAGSFALPRVVGVPVLAAQDVPLFKISLAEWSLHRSLSGGGLDHLDFARAAKSDYGIDAVEYVNRFFVDKARQTAYLREMKRRADDVGVSSLVIMCDREGSLGDPDAGRRTRAVENHYKWVEAAAYLGCHSIRVNARSEGSYQEQMRLTIDGLRRLVEYGDQHRVNVLVENHGGLSSNGQWLTGVMDGVAHPRCGTLPDFGNWGTYGGDSFNDGYADYDRYEGVEQLMPYAKAVSAKTHTFDAQGNEAAIDYVRMLRIVLGAGYRGYLGIEYEGDRVSEPEGIRATKRLLERLRKQLAKEYG